MDPQSICCTWAGNRQETFDKKLPTLEKGTDCPVPGRRQKQYYRVLNREIIMAMMSTCPCGFTVISPRGDEDVKKHMSIHLKDAHPGTSMTEEELGKTIKT